MNIPAPYASPSTLIDVRIRSLGFLKRENGNFIQIYDMCDDDAFKLSKFTKTVSIIIVIDIIVIIISIYILQNKNIMIMIV